MKSWIPLAALAVLSCSATVASSAPNVRMGVYFDQAGTICSGTIPAGVPTEIYIVAHTPPGEERISGAEFRFIGLPESWVVYPVASPGTLTIGNPFGAGVNIAATTTQCEPQWSTFVMFTVLVLASEHVDNVRLELTRHTWSHPDPAFHCPLVTDCTYMYAKHCVTPSPCLVNSATSTPCDELTAVEATTWTNVRNMYR
jgi:hypothetical protein